MIILKIIITASVAIIYFVAMLAVIDRIVDITEDSASISFPCLLSAAVSSLFFAIKTVSALW